MDNLKKLKHFFIILLSVMMILILPTIIFAENGYWSALSSGGEIGVNGSVKALTVDASGNLYAGGHFTTAGGETVDYIAKWDGISWSGLSGGMANHFDLSVRALTMDAIGNLYAGGNFGKAGGVTAINIAKWDGNSWSALDYGLGGTVNALAIDDAHGNLYAGGYFDWAGTGSVVVNRIAEWDGTSWSALSSG